MNHRQFPVVFFTAAVAAVLIGAAFTTPHASQLIISYAPESLSRAFEKFTALWVGNWSELGQQFTQMQSGLFAKIFLYVVVAVPIVFVLHYIVWGPKRFPHSTSKVFFYGFFVRIIHWLAAIFMTLLTITGLMIIFSKYLGGGALLITARYVHAASAAGFTVTAVILFIAWIKDMLPALCDIKWLFMAGGYLSRTQTPVPAGRFNAGQKMWFWLATAGGLVMAYTGYFLFNHNASANELRLFAIIHNFLGAAILALFIVHLYMSLFAVKGSLSSMLTGYKSREEVEIMHSLYRP